MADSREIDLILKYLHSSDYEEVNRATLRIVEILESLTWVEDGYGGFKVCAPPEKPIEIEHINKLEGRTSKYSAHDLRIFKKVLIEVLSLDRKSRHDASCTWALGQFSGDDVKETLYKVLAANLNGNAHVLFQALVGLENMGVKVFEISGSSDEQEINRKIAARLLEEREK